MIPHALLPNLEEYAVSVLNPSPRGLSAETSTDLAQSPGRPRGAI
jgi:hypothetical protein